MTAIASTPTSTPIATSVRQPSHLGERKTDTQARGPGASTAAARTGFAATNSSVSLQDTPMSGRLWGCIRVASTTATASV